MIGKLLVSYALIHLLVVFETYLNWRSKKDLIAMRGWDLNSCKMVGQLSDIFVWLCPATGLIACLLYDDVISQLAHTTYAEDLVISSRVIFGFQVHYSDHN